MQHSCPALCSRALSSTCWARAVAKSPLKWDAIKAVAGHWPLIIGLSRARSLHPEHWESLRRLLLTLQHDYSRLFPQPVPSLPVRPQTNSRTISASIYSSWPLRVVMSLREMSAAKEQEREQEGKARTRNKAEPRSTRGLRTGFTGKCRRKRWTSEGTWLQNDRQQLTTGGWKEAEHYQWQVYLCFLCYVLDYLFKMTKHLRHKK